MKMFSRPYRIAIHLANVVVMVTATWALVELQWGIAIKLLVAIIAIPFAIDTIIRASFIVLDDAIAGRLFDQYYKLIQLMKFRASRFVTYFLKVGVYCFVAVACFELEMSNLLLLGIGVVILILLVDATYMLSLKWVAQSFKSEDENE